MDIFIKTNIKFRKKFIIGTKGANINRLQKQSACAISLNDNTVSISGNPKGITIARDIIFNDLLKGKYFKKSETMYNIPQYLIRFIIGTKGLNLKSIESQYSTKIDIKEKDDSKNCDILIQGNSTQEINSCIKKIKEIVDDNKHKVDNNSTVSKKTLHIPSHLHKYVIGRNGETIRTIENDVGCNIELCTNNNMLTIRSHLPSGAQEGVNRILSVISNCGWKYDTVHKSFVENNKTDEIFSLYRAEASKIAEQRINCIEDSQKAFKKGHKSKAKELSLQAKELETKLNEENRKAADSIFEYQNAKYDLNTIDLHGLTVDEALRYLNERILVIIKNKRFKQLNIITGAGNHSHKYHAKIKPRIKSLLTQKGLKSQTFNNGSFMVTL